MDPVDINETPYGHQIESVNQPLLDFMEWRLKDSNLFLLDLMKKASVALPKTEIAMAANPAWGSYSPIERGTSLADWISVIGQVPQCTLMIESDPRSPTAERQLQDLSAWNTVVKPAKIWMRFSAMPEQKSLESIEKYSSTGLNVHLLLAIKRRS